MIKKIKEVFKDLWEIGYLKIGYAFLGVTLFLLPLTVAEVSDYDLLNKILETPDESPMFFVMFILWIVVLWNFILDTFYYTLIFYYNLKYNDRFQTLHEAREAHKNIKYHDKLVEDFTNSEEGQRKMAEAEKEQKALSDSYLY